MMNNDSIDHYFVQQLNEAIEQSHLDPVSETAFKLAALHVDFRLLVLKSELIKMEAPLKERSEEALVDNSLFNELTDIYTLQEDIRTEIISRMSNQEINNLISQMELAPDNWRQGLYNRLLKKDITALKQLQPSEYVQAYTFFRWIKHPDIPLPPGTELLKLIRR